MNRYRSAIPCSNVLLSLLLLAAITFIATRGDLPDPCSNSSKVAVTHDGDMAILMENSESSRRRRAAVTDERLWPDGIVYYTIDPTFSAKEKMMIMEGMKHWEDHTCVRFHSRVDEENYIHFLAGKLGCCSYVGMTGHGKQPVSLKPSDCMHFPVIVHEIGHVIGFYHEQSRPDRDDYVDISEENILPGFEDNFQKKTLNEVNSLEIGYDYNSIMHYHSTAFGENEDETIVAHDPNIVVGEAQELSPLDIIETNLLYNCTEPHPPTSIPEKPTTLSKPPTNWYSCGEVFNEQLEGTLTSPGYPKYAHNKDCSWVIKIPPGYLLTLTFKPVSMEFSFGCVRDYIDIYTALSPSGKHLGHICGTYPSYIFSTRGSEFLIHYHTDARNTGSDAAYVKGFSATFKATDIDECSQRYGSAVRCSHGCLNTKGSFTCTCKEGYYLSADGFTCFDNNECAIDNGGCDHKCENYGGYFTCSCKDGYVLQSNGRTCLSEKGIEQVQCSVDNGHCQHECDDSSGTVICSCHEGYQLTSDKTSCKDRDECQDGSNLCSHICTNKDGSYSCSCPTGYELGADERLCTDINECLVVNGGCNHTCTNLPGSFECHCPQGYKLGEDRLDCVDINECYHRTGGCSHICTNTMGSFECSCLQGYMLGEDGLACVDINECLTFNCSGHGTCWNFDGTYFCFCDNTHVPTHNWKDCEDKDECLFNNGGCSHLCINTVGSYSCSCPFGMPMGADGKNCATGSSTPCSTNNGGCSHICTDTSTSFECSCPEGYSLGEDGLACADVNECYIDNGGCSHTCTNLPGSYECSCLQGYSLGEDGTMCTDINECLNFNCSGHGTCINTIGSHFCFCNHGSQPTHDFKDCRKT